jgi:hypothetical protein
MQTPKPTDARAEASSPPTPNGTAEESTPLPGPGPDPGRWTVRCLLAVVARELVILAYSNRWQSFRRRNKELAEILIRGMANCHPKKVARIVPVLEDVLDLLAKHPDLSEGPARGDRDRRAAGILGFLWQAAKEANGLAPKWQGLSSRPALEEALALLPNLSGGPARSARPRWAASSLRLLWLAVKEADALAPKWLGLITRIREFRPFDLKGRLFPSAHEAALTIGAETLEKVWRIAKPSALFRIAGEIIPFEPEPLVMAYPALARYFTTEAFDDIDQTLLAGLFQELNVLQAAAASTAADTPPAAGKRRRLPAAGAGRVTAEDLCVEFFLRDPNQSLREIARQAGCDPSIPARSERLKRLRQTYAGRLPRGSKSKDGSLEAEEEEE